MSSYRQSTICPFCGGTISGIDAYRASRGKSLGIGYSTTRRYKSRATKVFFHMSCYKQATIGYRKEVEKDELFREDYIYQEQG